MFQHIISEIRSKYFNLQLRGKISVALIVSVSLVGGLIMLITYSTTRHLIIEHTHDLLNSEANLDKLEIELKLAAEIQTASALAENLVTANALADTQESELYLLPYLKNQKHAFADTVLSLVDYRGRHIASNGNSKVNYSENATFFEMMHSSRSQVSIQSNLASGPILLAMLPVRYRLTNQVEGAVILEVPLESVLNRNSSHKFHWLVDQAGRVIVGEMPSVENLIISTKHDISLPLTTLKPSYYLAYDKAQALKKIESLLIQYLMIALTAIAGLLMLASYAARSISKPLERLSRVAREVTSSGWPHSKIDIHSHDEYGALAEAFNTMLQRLNETYRSLEARVKLRTHELESARNLLREAVENATQGFCIFDQHDRLVEFNEAYRQYTMLGDFIEIGRSYEEILNEIIDRKLFPETIGQEALWKSKRLKHHQDADASPLELQRKDGRWFMAQEVRSPGGFVIASRVDITELKQIASTLEQRELYLRATLDNLPFMFWLKDAQSRFLAVNKAFADACGLANPEDAVGKTDFDVWPEELAEQYRNDDDDVIANLTEKHVEEPMNGTYGPTWIETYKKPVLTEDGEVMGTVGFARDIGDRKKVELALAEAEMRWSLAMRGANDGVWDWNLLTNQVYFSERWKTMLGYENNEVSDQFNEWESRIHPDDYERSLELLQAHLRGETEFYNNEHRLRCKDGSYKWILARGKAFINEQGEPIRITGSHTDVSDKKRADAIIIDRTQQLDEIFALSPDGFVSFDHRHQFKYANPAFLRLCNLKSELLQGLDEEAFSQLLADQCTPDSRFIGIAALKNNLKHSTENSEDQTEVTVTGKGQIVEMAGPGNRLLEISLQISKAQTVSEILYVRDVSYEVEISRIKSEFLSTAAHELRTPMSSIYGYSEMLLAKRFSDERQREFHEIIHKQAELVSEILNELLDLQRIESRRGKDFVFNRINIANLIADTVNMYKVPAGRSLPKLYLPKAQLFIRADYSKMIQVINNVLSNAYKYSPQGGDVEIKVLTSRKADKKNLLGIQIKDYGIGMTKEQLARVCERFYRADTTGVLPGTGLGMSIVKEIVELHCGSVAIESEYGKGTRVNIWLPLDLKAEDSND